MMSTVTTNITERLAGNILKQTPHRVKSKLARNLRKCVTLTPNYDMYVARVHHINNLKYQTLNKTNKLQKILQFITKLQIYYK